MWTEINNVLNDAQQKKFMEIYFQANNGLNSPSLDAWLLAVVDLTDGQKEAIGKLVADRVAALPAGGGAGQITPQERAAINTRFGEQIKAVLTEQQKEKAEKLTEGAAELRRTLGIGPQRQQGGQGAGQGQGAGRQGGRQQGGFSPGGNNWQPGQ
jgi:hypothetical protein